VVIEDAPHGIAWAHGDEINEALVPFLVGRTVGKVATKAGVA
jgi:hypothetical protein